jgi:hypothetical protein
MPEIKKHNSGIPIDETKLFKTKLIGKETI